MATFGYTSTLPAVGQASADAAVNIVNAFSYIGTFLTGQNIGSSMLDTSALNAAVPVGSIMPYAGTTEPSLWKFCNGQSLSRTTYSDLFNKLLVSGAPAYGYADASTFYLPDLRGRAIYGLGSHADVDALGDNDALTVASRTPKNSHQHTVPAHKHAISSANMTVTVASNTTNYIANTGSGSAYMAASGGFGPYASVGSHTHTATASGTAGSTSAADGDVGTLATAGTTIFDPYLVLNFLIKVGV
jgi:microcystin-dependent protein